MLDAVFLRISDDTSEAPADFEFLRNSAPWASHGDIVLSDEVDLQSFLEYRTTPLFQLRSGDKLNSMLPAGLTDELLANHFTAVYRIQGIPILWAGDVFIVPESSAMSSAPLFAVAAIAFILRRRRH
jgi:hypothetical protein